MGEIIHGMLCVPFFYILILQHRLGKKGTKHGVATIINQVLVLIKSCIGVLLRRHGFGEKRSEERYMLWIRKSSSERIFYKCMYTYVCIRWFFGCHYGNVTVKLIFHVKQFILLRHFRGISLPFLFQSI